MRGGGFGLPLSFPHKKMGDFDQWRLLRHKVLIEAFEDPSEISGILMPETSTPTYPSSGIVRQKGILNSHLNIGDSVILDTISEAIEAMPFKSLRISVWTVSGEVDLFVDPEMEPYIKEAVKRAAKGENLKITLSDLEGKEHKFSNLAVVDYTLGEETESPFELSIPTSAQFFSWLPQLGGKAVLMYLVHEDLILATMED